MSLMLRGSGVSRGIAIGPVRLLHEIQPRAVASHIGSGEEEKEVARLSAAMHKTITELRGLQARLKNKVPREIMTFLDSHLLMLEDEALTKPVIQLIEQKKYTSEWALARHRDRLVAMFEKIDDAYLRQRAEDVENVIAKVLRKLGGAKPATTKRPSQGYIVVTSNLAAADVLEHQQDGMRGLICSHGGKMSHAAIIARGLRIPAVTAVHPALTLLREEDRVIVDGSSGMVVAAPDKRSLRHYQKAKRDEKKRQHELRTLVDKPTITRDGIAVSLLANVDSPADASMARRLGAEGIGLYRTDSLYANRDDLPDEREQLSIYRRVIRAMQGRPVTLRTIDLPPAAITQETHHTAAAEPALGLRGVRLSLGQPALLETQIRAMLRASSAGPIRILLPMVSSVAELQLARTNVERIRLELLKDKREVADEPQIGALIEVPAAALAARQLAKHTDFFAIGSNDLTQYTLAVAREDDEVQHLYDPLHAAVLRLISEVIAVGSRAQIPVVLCGELGSDPRVCRLLLGLGLRHFSVHPASLLEVKDAIRRTNVGSIQSLARRILNSDSRARTERILDQLLERD